MRLHGFRFWLGLGLVNLMAVSVVAGTKSPYASVQSSLRPLGWSLADQVQVYGADANAQGFMTQLPGFVTTIGSSLKEGVAFAAANNSKLDPQRLYFFSDYAPRIYFVSNGGYYTDALGVTIGPAVAPNGQPPTGTNYLVFPSTNSCYSNTCPAKQTNGKRTSTVPLLSGDFVQLPTVRAGQQLALVFMTNMNSQGTPAAVFYNDSNANADKYQHMVGFFPNSSQYIIVGFEDLYGGGDGDYNDVIVVVDIGAANAQVLRDAANGTLPR